MMSEIVARRVAVLALLAGCHVLLGAAEAGARKVIVIGVDGASPRGIRNAAMPNLDELRRNGAYTFHARGVLPTVSSPNWASMIMGAGPEQHGITSNDWQPDKFEIPPRVQGPGGIFPTIFSLLRQQRPQALSACFHDWKGFARLLERQAPDVLENGNGPVDTIRKAVACLRARQPDFTFIQLDHVDHAGHKFGHGTPEYRAAIEKADELIGAVVKAVDETGMRNDTVLLVTADHGGKGKRHGDNSLESLEIFWIISGAGIARGRELSWPVNIFDTAPTVAHILGLKPPACWTGRAVLEALR